MTKKKIKKEDCFIIFNFDTDTKSKKQIKTTELICIKLGIAAFEEMFESKMEDLIPHIDEEQTAVVTKIETLKV